MVGEGKDLYLSFEVDEQQGIGESFQEGATNFQLPRDITKDREG